MAFLFFPVRVLFRHSMLDGAMIQPDSCICNAFWVNFCNKTKTKKDLGKDGSRRLGII